MRGVAVGVGVQVTPGVTGYFMMMGKETRFVATPVRVRVGVPVAARVDVGVGVAVAPGVRVALNDVAVGVGVAVGGSVT